MKAIVCELCGSNDIIKQDGLYVCQHCGTKYSLEEAKKLLGTVKIDRSEEFEKYMELARACMANDDIKNAKTYYAKVLNLDPANIEARASRTSLDCWDKIGKDDNIESFIQAAHSISLCFRVCFDLAHNKNEPISKALNFLLDNANGMIGYLFEYRYQKVLNDVGDTPEHRQALNKNCFFIIEAFHKTYLEIEKKLLTDSETLEELIELTKRKHLMMLETGKKYVSTTKLRKQVTYCAERSSAIQRVKALLRGLRTT